MLDLHVDSVIQNRLFGYRPSKRHGAGVRAQPLFWHADIPRMKEAHYRGACMGMHYFPRESEAGWRELNKQLDVVDSLALLDGVEKADTRAWSRLARSTQDAGNHTLLLAAGVEGAHMINRRLERVEELAARQIAYMTLVHLGSNSAAKTSWGFRSDPDEGLSAWGRELVVALERSRILIDVAHVNHPGVMDVCAMAARPVLCTHIACRALHDHPRNLRDEAIDAIAETGGVIGVIFCPKFLTGKLFSPSEEIARHAAHIAERVGVGHVAMGSDFDGWIATIPHDMRDCRDIDKVEDALRDVGFDADDVERIMWRNAARVLSQPDA